ncbi:MAG: cupin domain-containing protein [Halioglobus sp.]
MTQGRLKLDRQQFLANHWQQTPLLIRNAIADFEPPIDANELAGLALEDGVESRIIESHDDNWHLTTGPFQEQDFNRDKPWTLLVQAVDHYIPEVAQLRQVIDFIPTWRVDDIMVSYAVDGGSVGPHYDNYDVFLLQGEGKRTWKLGQMCDEHTALRKNSSLRILEDFECTDEYTLSCGDILYVPPGVAHWGIAEGDCTTFSIGFRAPRLQELVSRSVDSWLEQNSGDRFYRDPPLTSDMRPGEILPCDLASAKQQLLSALSQADDGIWFGELLTEPKYPVERPADEQALDLTSLRHIDAAVELLPDSRLAWQQQEDAIIVFANGQNLSHPTTVVDMLLALCSGNALSGDSLTSALNNPECAILLGQLWELGCIDYH